jgi:hypothetical protein
MTFCRLIAPLTIAVLAIGADEALAQSAFPAPLPGQAGVPAAPPVSNLPDASLDIYCHTFQCILARAGGFSVAQGEQCAKEFIPLREDAERRGELTKDALAAPDEACKLIRNFADAEIRMIRYVESHASCWTAGRCRPAEERSQEHRSDADEGVCDRAADTAALSGYPIGPVGPVGDFPPYYGR